MFRIKRDDLMNKKAISPLIATVLLIGFTVIIAVAIWMWYGSIIREQMQKDGALNEIKTDCTTQISLIILSAQKVSGNAVLEIKNDGTALFNGIRIMVQSNGESLVEKESFSPGEQKSLTFPGKTGKLDVMPMIVRQGVTGTCAEKKVTVDI
ncbi:MAG: hypothetical protein PHD81_00425 [Candidatus Nanoarchaeia archaeon]|nr:hypothetical protein [Candidatus Nanoarchaeia archaeon]MDD5587555.1 hypothetical protein [Candidatus Nanoarchaeia archaeon]